MAIDFPNSPTLNQEYTVNNKTWKWDVTVWNLVASGLVGPTGATGSTGANANRNLIINGNFSINQRGYTSGSLIPEGLYCFDRWKNSTSLFTVSLTYESFFRRTTGSGSCVANYNDINGTSISSLVLMELAG